VENPIYERLIRYMSDSYFLGANNQRYEQFLPFYERIIKFNERFLIYKASSPTMFMSKLKERYPTASIKLLFFHFGPVDLSPWPTTKPIEL